MKRLSARRKNAQPIRNRILIRMGVLILIQAVLLSGILYFTGMVQKLNENAVDILTERVINRKNYLENEMVDRWSNVSLTVEQVNQQRKRGSATATLIYQNWKAILIPTRLLSARSRRSV